MIVCPRAEAKSGGGAAKESRRHLARGRWNEAEGASLPRTIGLAFVREYGDEAGGGLDLGRGRELSGAGGRICSEKRDRPVERTGGAELLPLIGHAAGE